MRFQSKYPSLRVVVKPSFYRFDNLGNRVFIKGETAEFQDGWYETADEEIIAALKQNKSYGVDFWSIDEKVQPNPQGVIESKILEKKTEEVGSNCPFCGFEAKNKAGLSAHVRINHPDKMKPQQAV